MRSTFFAHSTCATSAKICTGTSWPGESVTQPHDRSRVPSYGAAVSCEAIFETCVRASLRFVFCVAAGVDTLLVADLEFASVDVIQLCVAVEEHYGRKLGFQDLLMHDGSYVQDLALGEMVRFIAKQVSGV